MKRLLAILVTGLLLGAIVATAAPAHSSATIGIKVTSSGDSGPGSLRWAIDLANQDSRIVKIYFDKSVRNITIHSPLTLRTDQRMKLVAGVGSPVTIRGTDTGGGVSRLLSHTGGGNLFVHGLKFTNSTGTGIWINTTSQSGDLLMKFFRTKVTNVASSGMMIWANRSQHDIRVVFDDVTIRDFGDRGIGLSGRGPGSLDVVVRNADIQADYNGDSDAGSTGGVGIQVTEQAAGNLRFKVVSSEIARGLVVHELAEGDLRTVLRDVHSFNGDWGIWIEESAGSGATEGNLRAKIVDSVLAPEPSAAIGLSLEALQNAPGNGRVTLVNTTTVGPISAPGIALIVR